MKTSLKLLTFLFLLFLLKTSVFSSQTDQRMAEARELSKSGKYEEAIKIYDRILPRLLGTSIKEPFYRKGLCLHGLKRFKEAIATWQYLLSRYPSGDYSDDAALDIARTYAFNLKERDLAIRKYEQFLSRYPKSDRIAEARYQIAGVYYEKGDYKKALKSYERIATWFPLSKEYELAVYREGQCLSLIGKYEDAIRAWRNLPNHRPKSPYADDILLAIGDIYLEILNKSSNAIKSYQKLLSSYPGSNLTKDANHNIGLCYFQQGKFNVAKEVFQKELASLPKVEKAPPTGLERLIDACDKKKSYVPEHKTDRFNKAVTVLVNLGDMHFAEKDYKKAANAYRKAMKEVPGTEDAAYALMQWRFPGKVDPCFQVILTPLFCFS